VWENLSFPLIHTAAASVTIGDLTVEPMGALGTGTAKILRMIGHFMFFTEASALDILQLFLGIAVVTNDAFAALATPDPASDFQQSWYYWTAPSVTSISTANKVSDVHFDIRTQRVLRSGYKLVFVTENVVQENALVGKLTFRNLWEVD